MKKKIIITFLIGIIVSIIIDTYLVSIVYKREVSYIDNKNIKSTSDSDYINGVYSSTSTLNSHITTLESKITGTQKLTYHTGTGTLGSNGKLFLDTGNTNVFSAGAIRTNDATMVISTAVQAQRYLRFQYSEVSIPISYYYWTFETN